MRRSNDLSEEQKKLIPLIAEGMKNTQIAEKISLSLRSVDYHIAQIADKLNIFDVNAKVRIAYLYGKGEIPGVKNADI